MQQVTSASKLGAEAMVVKSLCTDVRIKKKKETEIRTHKKRKVLRQMPKTKFSIDDIDFPLP